MLDLGQLYLVPDVRQLKDVKITAVKQLIHQEINRLSYDVQADPDSKVLSVMDMIVKVPLLSVDGEENIKLKGSGNYRIFINGRPSSMLARNPKDALKAIAASSVLRIEVITTPPSKYNAKGLVATSINWLTTAPGSTCSTLSLTCTSAKMPWPMFGV